MSLKDTPKKFTVQHRVRVLVNTDPQRRCYNGAHFSSELQWTAWEVLASGVTAERLDNVLTFWKELNEYAVSQRGEGARREFRVEEE